MPFVRAAEMGTRKVIYDHATIGMLVTTDGTIGDIPRASYVQAEERIVSELKSIGKPFAIILNTVNPSAKDAIDLAYELEGKYGVPVALVNCLDLNADDIRHILEMLLHEFPVCEIEVELPEWLISLDQAHRVRRSVEQDVRRCAENVRKAGDVGIAFEALKQKKWLNPKI